LKFCEEKLGVAKLDQFQTVDLYEKQNMSAVLDQIHACGRRVRFSFFLGSTFFV